MAPDKIQSAGKHLAVERTLSEEQCEDTHTHTHTHTHRHTHTHTHSQLNSTFVFPHTQHAVFLQKRVCIVCEFCVERGSVGL